MHVERARQIAHVALLTVQVFLRQTADLLLNRDRLLNQSGAREQALAGPRRAPELVPQAKHPLDGGKHVAGEMFGVRCGGELPDSLEGALQVSPAELGQPTVVTQVGRTTIRTEDASECFPQQLYQHPHAPAAGDVVEHNPREAQPPNPPLFSIAPPTAFAP